MYTNLLASYQASNFKIQELHFKLGTMSTKIRPDNFEISYQMSGHILWVCYRKFDG